MTISQWTFTSQFEGVVPHMYLDERGNVTCGVGFLLAHPSDAQQLQFACGSFEATQDWHRIHESEPGHSPAYYEKMCHCALSNTFMREEFERRVDVLMRALEVEAPNDAVHPSPWVGAIDMAYNLGVEGLTRDFPKFMSGWWTGNYRLCADECHRIGVQPARNVATRQLFLDAAGVV